MEIAQEYKPELLLLQDAYMGNANIFAQKLDYLSRLAQPEQWNYNDPQKEPNQILKNYLFYTYDRIKQENKIIITDEKTEMCFNTGLQTVNGNDIYAYFQRNTSTSLLK